MQAAPEQPPAAADAAKPVAAAAAAAPGAAANLPAMLANLNPAALAALATTMNLPPQLAQQFQLLAATAAGAGAAGGNPAAAAALAAAAAAQASAKPVFSLTALMGDLNGPLSEEQVLILQKAIRSAKADLQTQLLPLASLSPAQLHELLTQQQVNIKDVSVCVACVQALVCLHASRHVQQKQGAGCWGEQGGAEPS